nr:T9SS type A sorting domain-containing protein [Bacteroidota bacterium]
MKKLLVTLFFTVFFIGAKCQSLKWLQNQDIVTSYPNGAGNANYLDVDFSSSGHAYVIGARSVTDPNGITPVMRVIDITKIDANGDTIATFTFADDNVTLGSPQSPKMLEGAFVKVDDAGNVYAVGNSGMSSFLLKFDSDLNLLYKKRFWNLTTVSCGMSTSYFYVCGNTDDGGVVLKYRKSNGALLKYALYENAAITSGEITSTGFATAGRIDNNINSDELFVQRLDSSLNISWTFLYNYANGNYSDEAKELKVVNDVFYVGGTGNNSSGSFGVLLKINSIGVLQWARQLSASNVNYAFTSMTVDAANGASYVLADARRILKYSTAGLRSYNKLISQPLARPLSLYHITTNGKTGTAATALFVTGGLYTNFFKYYNGQSYIDCIGTQGFSAFLNPANAAISFQDTFYVDNIYPGMVAEFIDYKNFRGKLNSKVNPPLLYALGGGKTGKGTQQEWHSSRQLFCYNIIGSLIKKADVEETKTQTKAYPNPADEKLFFEGDFGNATVTVYDITGKKIFTQQLVNANHQLDISALKAGIYYANILGPNVNYQTKFCKQDSKK